MIDNYLDQLRIICSRFPEAEESLLQDRPLFHVRRRRIAIYNSSHAPRRKRWQDWDRSLHFATSPEQYELLADDDRFAPSPHHHFRGWVGLALGASVDWEEVSGLLLSAYRHVANKTLVAELEGRIIHE